jgi:hypothetical protein
MQFDSFQIMSKRKLEEFLNVANERKPAFQNSLDSDEEDDEAKEENYDIMHENDIEGKLIYICILYFLTILV